MVGFLGLCRDSPVTTQPHDIISWQKRIFLPKRFSDWTHVANSKLWLLLLEDPVSLFPWHSQVFSSLISTNCRCMFASWKWFRSTIPARSLQTFYLCPVMWSSCHAQVIRISIPPIRYAHKINILLISVRVIWVCYFGMHSWFLYILQMLLWIIACYLSYLFLLICSLSSVLRFIQVHAV